MVEERQRRKSGASKPLNGWMKKLLQAGSLATAIGAIGGVLFFLWPAEYVPAIAKDIQQVEERFDPVHKKLEEIMLIAGATEALTRGEMKRRDRSQLWEVERQLDVYRKKNERPPQWLLDQKDSLESSMQQQDRLIDRALKRR